MNRSTFKRSLSLTLTFSMGLSTFAPLALSQTAGSPQAPPASDAASLLIAAMKSGSPLQAKNLLEQVKAQLPNENLPADSASKLDALIQVVQQPKQQLTGVQPALRELMGQVSKGRVVRDASQLQTTMPQEINEQNIKDLAIAGVKEDPSILIKTLRSTGLVSDDAAEMNALLRDKYEGVSTDFLADRIIKDYTLNSAGLGALRDLSSRIGSMPVINKLGIVGEAGATFVTNTNLVLRLIDLYGLRLSAANQEVVVMSVFATFKAGAQLGIKSKKFELTAGKTGSLFAKASLSQIPGAMSKYVGVVLNHPYMLRLLRRSPIDLGQVSKVLAPTPGTSAVANVEVALPVKQMSLSTITFEALSLLSHVGFSAMETYGVGQAAKIFIKNAILAEREASNESLRQLLLSPKGDGFFKLLILSMNAGNQGKPLADPSASTDPKVAFIKNLARSTKRCSPTDKLAYEKAVEKRNQTLAGKNKLAGKVEDKSKTAPLEDRILRYECAENLNQDSYNRLMEEFVTFNAIPEDLVTGLRLEKYGTRVQLGEIIYQLMFLDGGIDNEELAFFNGTIAKILGLEMFDGMRHFDKFHSFIVDHNGMVKNPESPTGYSIGSATSANPFDLKNGFTIPGGPQLDAKQAQSK